MDIAAQRMQNQKLAGEPFQNPADAVQWFGAVQSQDYPGAKWALAQRVAGVDDVELDRAFAAGELLRTHVLRPTWHFVHPADIRWMLELTGPRVHASIATYYRRNGIDDATVRLSREVLIRELEGGRQRTRSEIAAAFEASGIVGDAMRRGFIILHAELDGLICSGALRGKQHTYALLEERAPAAKSLPRDEALAELAIRYFTSHGPAQVQDFSWWSGLTMADTRAGIALAGSQLQSETIDGKTYWLNLELPVSSEHVESAHLLPNYDEYLVAYKDRSAAYDPSAFAGHLAVESALLNNIVVIDSQVVGGWRREIKRKRVTIEASLVSGIDDQQRAALEAEAARYSAFLGLPVDFDIKLDVGFSDSP